MLRLILLLFISNIIVGCGSKEDDVVLKNPPFESLTDSIQKDPQNAELWYRRGVLLYQNDYPAYARTDVEKAWTLQPKEEYALSLASLLKRKSVDSSILFLERAAENVKGSVAILVALSRAYIDKKDWNKALTISDVILTQYPSQLDALVIKSEILDSLGRKAESLATLEKAYSFAPSDIDIVYTLAQRWAEEQDPRVIPLSDSLIQVDVEGRHAEPYLLKGIYHYHKKDYKAAIDLFNQAITRDYNNLDAHMYKGQVYFDQKKYADAFKTFQLAASITPSYADAWYWMAQCQEAVGNKPEAKTNYQRAYGLDKELVEAKASADRL